MRLLKRTLRGPDVGRCQHFLIGQGLLDGAADGIFGDQTDAAMRAFQGRECLEVDGIVGPNTRESARAAERQLYIGSPALSMIGGAEPCWARATGEPSAARSTYEWRKLAKAELGAAPRDHRKCGRAFVIDVRHPGLRPRRLPAHARR
jgi:Putative peptidoglycan binding domain